MKKLLWAGMALLALGGLSLAVWFFFGKAVVYRAENLLPSQTILFLDFPNARAAEQRFRDASMGKIWAEPEVRSFLKRPEEEIRRSMARYPAATVFAREILKILKTAEGEVFLALTDVTLSPRLDCEGILGLDSGKQASQVERAVEVLMTRCRVERPSAEFEERVYESVSYKVWSPNPKVKIAFGRLGNFYLFSYGETPLRQAIERSRDKTPDRLSRAPVFTANRAKFQEADAWILVHPQAVFNRFESFLAIQPDWKERVEAMLPFRSMAGTFVLKDHGVESHSWTEITPASQQRMGWNDFKKCGRRTLAAAGQDCMLYAAMGLDAVSWWDRVMAGLDTSGGHAVAQSVQETLRSLESQGVRWREDLLSRLGPEMAVILDWQPPRHPSFSFIAEARRTEEMRETVEKIFRWVQGNGWGASSKMETTTGAGGAKILSLALPLMGAWASPSFCVSDDFAVLSLDRHSAEQILQTLKEDRKRLAATPEFQTAEARFKGDYTQFIYCDEKRVFECFYNMACGLLLNVPPGAFRGGAAMDASLLPKTETIARHLFPGVWVGLADAHGFQQRSFGPVNLPILTLGAVGGSLASAVSESMPGDGK